MGRTRTGRKRIVAAVAALAVMASVPGVAEANAGAQEGCTPGAPGIGDPYYPNYGNGGYNVSYYEIDASYDPATDALDASTWIEARASQSLCSFNLDLVGLTVRGVWVNDRPATWTRDDHELTVTPRRPLRQGQRFNVTVDYDGVPTEFEIPGFDVRTGFMATPEGATVAGQPEVAAGWFPVNDHPLDKAAYRFDITVPNGYEVVANGYLRRQRTRGDSTTWSWDAPDPMASYLATIDISDWDVNRWRTESGYPVYDAVDTRLTGGLRAQIDSSLARQGEVLDLLEGAFGPYPFGTLGAIVPNQDDFFFALETQTRSVYSKLFWLDNEGNPVNGDFVVVHELAHQWFGDDVALARWQDIWLNEGFATYAEWLWEEYEGRGTPQETFRATYDAIPADDPFWSVVIGDPGVELLFDNAVYVRGAMTLQALRLEVGDEAFWEIVRTWAATKSGGNGTTPEFIALAEDIAGQQLDAVFDTWLFTAGKPAFPDAAAAASGAEASQLSTAEVQSSAAAWLADLNRRLALGRF